MSEVEEKAPSIKGGNNKLGICLLFISLCLALGSLFSSGGSGSIGDSDMLHYLGKDHQYVQAYLGQPSYNTASGGSMVWGYGANCTINFYGATVASIILADKTYQAGGCSVGDSIKSVESTVKKYDGKLVNSEDDYYFFQFKYENTTYGLECLTQGNSVAMLSISK